MSRQALRYAVVTPARDEAHNLSRLAAALSAQDVPPETWLVVENGSADETRLVAEGLAATRPWMRVLSVPGTSSPVRGAPIVRSLHTAFEALDPVPDVVVNVDADISLDPDYFEKLIARFADDQYLGIASGTCLEQTGGEWRERFVTGTTVWGASRAYRWECLQDVLPLEERMGWDGLDEFKANALGWTTRTFRDLPFRHHRPEGERDGPGRLARTAQGRAAHYAGYRPWYLVLRALFQAHRDPSALVLIWGYSRAAIARAPRCPDERVTRYVRSQQHPRHLLRRAREAVGMRST